MQIRWGKTPIWFKLINLLFLLPIVFWPIVFFGSVFMFDNPNNNFFLMFLLFLLINGYPLFLLFLMYLNSRLFRKIKLLAISLPLIFSSLITYQAFNFLGGFDEVIRTVNEIYIRKANVQEPNNRQTIGYGYSKDSLNIYFANQPLKNADIESFELINFNWAKDNEMVYWRGQPIPMIDSKSFEYLKNGYSKDKNHIYYDSIPINGADIATFKIPWGDSDYASDSLNCYRKEKIIACDDMPKDTTYIIQSY